MRVHELAKELGLSSKDVIARLKSLKIAAASHMSTIDDKVAQNLIQKAKSPGTKKAAAKPAPEHKTSPLKAAKKITETKVKPVKEQPAPPSSSGAPARTEKVISSPVKQAVKPIESEKPGREIDKPAPAQEETKVQKVFAEKAPPPPSPLKPVDVDMPITVGGLGKSLNISTAQLIKALMGMGIFANINQMLDEEVVKRVGVSLNFKITRTAEKEKEDDATGRQIKDKEADLVSRCPVVTMMGHVDHGKTSLLDAIRKTNVAAGEVGHITQHIGAYEVRRGEDKFITFLDTPGHAAFTSMRARGAMVTDVVVLVVGADDGVMPQTIEAIDHAREAGCPLVVAINKTDLPSANPDRVRQQLQKHDLVPEEWGGRTIMVPVSAKTGKGIENLLESLLLESEILELKANPKRPAEGTVLEGRLTKGEGPTATVIIRNGTLRVGEPVICGAYFGKVRALRNNIHQRLESAIPGQAVVVLGLSGVPEAADELRVVGTLAEARERASKVAQELRHIQLSGSRNKHLTLDDLHSKIAEGKIKDLKIVLKADMQGSLEALAQSLETLSKAEVRLHVIHGATGDISESDVMLAAASDAVVIGFHVKAANADVENAIEKEGIDVRYYNIIYDAVTDVTKAMEGMLDPTFKEVFTGRGEIRKIFTSSKVGTIGGAYVTKGAVGRTNKVKIIRNNTVVYEGKFSALRRFKDDVKDVKEGFECGMSFEGFNDLREHDIVESYRLERVAGKTA